MSPEYLRELADLAEPDELWRMSPFDQMDLEPSRRKQLDAGVALRRHAAHVARLLDLIGTGKSLVITPLTPNSTAVMTISARANHKKLLSYHKGDTK